MTCECSPQPCVSCLTVVEQHNAAVDNLRRKERAVVDAARAWVATPLFDGAAYASNTRALIAAVAALDSGEPAATPPACWDCGHPESNDIHIGSPGLEAQEWHPFRAAATPAEPAHLGLCAGPCVACDIAVAAGSTPAGHEDCGNCLHPYGKHCTCCPDNCRGND